MNKIEAKEILREVAELYRSRSHSDLTNMIEGFIWMTRKGESETEYQIQICAFIDDEKTGNVRCVISIDDGGFFSAASPLSEDFIKDSNNKFIGE